MLLAEDFRAIARDALRGRWLRAAGVGLLAGLLGAGIDGTSVNLNTDILDGAAALFQSDFFYRYRIFFMIGGAMFLVYVLVCLVIGGAATLGYARYNLDLVDGKDPDVTELFSQFHRIWQGFCLQFLRFLYTFLWSLLFVIPGIIAQYRYSMAAYILAENPEMTAGEAITRSKELMVGNKLRFFCLGFSFIGWVFLCTAPIILIGGIAAGPMVVRSTGAAIALMAIGTLLSYICLMFLTPYMEAANAAFYRDISRPAAEPEQAEETALPQQIF